MHRIFKVILLPLLVGSILAAEKTNDVDAMVLVDEFLQTIMQDGPLPYEFEEKFFLGNPALAWTLYIEAGKMDDRTGEWIGPRPEVSLLGKLLQRSKTLFIPPDNSTKIHFCHKNDKSNSILVIYVYYTQPGRDIFSTIDNNLQIAKTMIFTITNYKRLGIDLLHSSINGVSIPAQIGFQLKQVQVKMAPGEIRTKINPTLPKELLESLVNDTIMP